MDENRIIVVGELPVFRKKQETGELPVFRKKLETGVLPATKETRISYFDANCWGQKGCRQQNKLEILFLMLVTV